MSDQQDIGYYKSKLQQKDAQFESYKQQCRQLEQMLEQDCQKKQTQIKQLKQQAIKRQKGQKMLKTQVSQLQAEVQNLKGQLVQATKNQSSNYKKQQLTKYQSENKLLKQKITQLQATVQQFANLKTSLTTQLEGTNKKIQQLRNSLTDAQKKVQAAQTSASTVVVPQPSNNTSNSANTSKLQQQIKKLKQKISQLQKQKSKQQKHSFQQIAKLKHDYQQKLKKITHTIPKQQKLSNNKRQHSLEPKQPSSHNKQSIPLTEHKSQISKLKQTIRSLQQHVQKHQHHQQQTKHKIQSLSNQKGSLLEKVKKLARQLQKQRDRVSKFQQQSVNQQENNKYQSPNKRQSSQQIMVMDHQQHNIHETLSLSPITFDCLLLTKRHYISPFIQIKDSKMIKFYKSTKNGFQKSLGATKHKFSSVGYDSQSLVHKTISNIKQGIQNQLNHHTVLLYGSKRTSKKYLMASLVQQLKSYLLQKIDQCANNSEQEQQNQTKCVYMKRSSDQEKNYLKQSTNNKDQIIEIIQQIIAMGQSTSPTTKSHNKSFSTNKKNQKPKIRYFNLSIGEALNIEFITTSYLNPFIKNNQTFMDYINTVVYSKLPNVLQSSLTYYHIITTLNPIVNLYEECRNTLSITLVPFNNQHQANSQSLEGSPMGGSNVYYSNSPQTINREDLNDLTKKKLESFEKQTELAGLKVRKYEQQCLFYKNRFQELQVRLKNLINTHQQQNTYLKKSPVTLSYEKLLKFVNTVLARNVSLTSSSIRGNISPNFGGNTQTAQQYQDQVNIYIEEDAKSLDGY